MKLDNINMRSPIYDHPKEKSVSRNDRLVTIFSLDDEEEKLPLPLIKFKDTWIFGSKQEETVFKDVKNIYNHAIKNCINAIRREYSFDKDGSCNSFVMFISKVLEKEMIKK